MNQKELIVLLKEKEIQSIFKKSGIQHLWLFWSYAKNTAKKESDIDLLYEYDEKKDTSFWWVFSIYGYLQTYIKQHIDLVIRKSRRSLFQKDVFNSMIKIF